MTDTDTDAAAATDTAATATAEAEIRAMIDDWAEATRALDVARIMAHFTDDAVVHDCHSAFRFPDAAAYRAHLEACFPHMRAPVGFALHDLEVAAGGDVAYCHYSCRFTATDPEGGAHDAWFRGTAGLRRAGDGRWRFAHAHLSAPFDPQTGQAMMSGGGAAPDASAAAGAA